MPKTRRHNYRNFRRTRHRKHSKRNNKTKRVGKGFFKRLFSRKKSITPVPTSTLEPTLTSAYRMAVNEIKNNSELTTGEKNKRRRHLKKLSQTTGELKALHHMTPDELEQRRAYRRAVINNSSRI